MYYFLKGLLSLCVAVVLVWLSAFEIDFAVLPGSLQNGTVSSKGNDETSVTIRLRKKNTRNTKKPLLSEYSARNLHTLLNDPDDSLPEPLQVLKEYITQHRADDDGYEMEALKEDDGRKYVIQGYVCPEQAGNMMGQALNAFLLAILTNRTLVMIPLNPEECHPVMKTADWIPTLRNASSVPPEMVRVTPLYRKTCKEIFNITFGAGKLKIACKEELTTHPEEAANLEKHPNWQDSKYITFGHGQNLGFEYTDFRAGYGNRYNMSDPRTFRYMHGMFPGELLKDEKIHKLFRHGMWFTYGMLWEYLFVNSPEFQDQVDMIQRAVVPEEETVGIHLRHPRVSDDGSDIERPQMCLEMLFDYPYTNGTENGQLLIMTDRVASNEALGLYAGTKGYAGLTIKTALERARRRRLAKEVEHGPFQGAGFFLDMELVSMSNMALAGTSRSSSQLVLELMAYRQGLQLYSREQGKLRRGRRPQYCNLHPRGCNCVDVFLDSEL